MDNTMDNAIKKAINFAYPKPSAFDTADSNADGIPNDNNLANSAGSSSQQNGLKCICLIESENHVRAAQNMILSGSFYTYSSLYPQQNRDGSDVPQPQDLQAYNDEVIKGRHQSAKGLYVLQFASVDQARGYLTNSGILAELALIVADIDNLKSYNDVATVQQAQEQFHALHAFLDKICKPELAAVIISRNQESLTSCQAEYPSTTHTILKPYKPDMLVDFVQTLLGINIKF